MTGQEAALRDLAAAWKKRADRDKVHADYMAEQAGKTYPAEEWPELLHRAQATIRETCARELLAALDQT